MAQARRRDMAFAEDLIEQFRTARKNSGLTQEQVDDRLELQTGLPRNGKIHFANQRFSMRSVGQKLSIKN